MADVKGGLVPPAVDRLAAGRAVTPVWTNQLGGHTFEIGSGGDRCFVKWLPAAVAGLLEHEAERLAWAVAFVTVPAVIGAGSDRDGAWLVTAPLRGTNAVTPRWTSDPAVAVRAIGEGLRHLHDTVPVEGCPFSWRAEARVADARRRARLGGIDPARWFDEHRHLCVDEALTVAGDIPPVDRLVVCHGDACAPNTLIGDDGRWSGHVDLGALGVADRWADLAVATWSTQWNYGPGWERPLLDAYGIDPDPVRTAYYRLLWEFGP